jgi:hypothetical protein
VPWPAPLSDGTWTASTAGLPPDAAANQAPIVQKDAAGTITWPVGLDTLACPEAGTCLAAGNYRSRNGTIQGLIETLSNGKWTGAKAPLPAEAGKAQQRTIIEAVACTSPGACVATGTYTRPDGRTEPLIATTG